MRAFHYRWEFDLRSSPEQLWPLVADTNRFNRDTGVPSLESVGNVGVNGRRRLALSTLGIPIEWEEQPFEWIRPFRFGVIRRYSKGPIAELRVIAELRPRENSSTNGSDTDDSLGTKLIYDVSATPRNILGFVAIPIQIGIVTARNFGRAFRRYDELAQHQETAATLATEVEFVPGGRSRLVTLGEKLVAEALDEELVALLVDYLENADDFAVSRIRPYGLARKWAHPPRSVLETCLHATRAGILDLQWNLICPMCRGCEAAGSLKDLHSEIHCPGCNIDFSVNFEQSVELTFRPNPSIRDVEVEMFCIGGPQVMPHVVAQQLLSPGASRSVDVELVDGRYRVRTMSIRGWQHLRV